jgi:hypothetical protein
MTQLLEFLADSLPPQDQRNLSYSSHQPKAFREWVDSLPVVNIGETAKLLYQGIQELCHLKASAAHRLQLLELIRPKVHYITESLKQHYAHQPILLSPKSRKIASLCQALQKHLAIGYKVCLINALYGGFLGTAKEHIPTAMHRFLSELVFILLRCYQLYHPPIPMLWFEIHLLYALAEERALLDHCLDDPELDHHRAHSISDLYKRAVLLSTCKPNQLQADDLENLFYGSNQWSNLAAITQDPSRGGLFASALNTDTPPGYVKDLQEQHHHVRYIDLRNVVKHLQHNQQCPKKLIGLKSEYRASERAFISNDLSRHLISAWSRASKRANERIPQSGPVEACLGMHNCYEHLCHLQDYHSLNTPRSLKLEDDDVIDMELAITKNINHNRRDKKLERFQCLVVNVSAQGVCLAWNQQLPMQLKNGELVMLRQQERQEWLLGSIRWTRHFHGEGVRTGVQFFAPNMIAVEVKHLRSSADSTEWLPGILMPPLEIGDKPTLLTARGGFHEGSQVLLQYEGEHTIVLEQVIRHSAGFEEYSIFSQGSLFSQPEKSGKTSNGKQNNSFDFDDDDLDSLWSEL